jgi:pyruvate/2-oxoglutarate dehydrogenase complex dihydrolipoamide dehydrogenase (E3) component
MEEAQTVTRLIRREGIDLRLESELQEIVGDKAGRVVAALTKTGDRIDCQLIGLTAGVRPNLSAVAGSGIPTRQGVLVDSQLRARVPDVFAAGDCAEIAPEGATSGKMEQLWYTGRMQGQVVGDVVCGKEASHDRGIWFNSAKFFDLEWHTYGLVSPHGHSPHQAGEQHLYWEHPDGRHSLRIVHHNGAIIGVNAMGLRYRHRTCERWIRERRSAEYVLGHLAEAAFDPELWHGYQREIRAKIQEQRR